MIFLKELSVFFSNIDREVVLRSLEERIVSNVIGEKVFDVHTDEAFVSLEFLASFEEELWICEGDIVVEIVGGIVEIECDIVDFLYEFEPFVLGLL